MSYDALRSTVKESDGAVDARVEVNQRALIDKILARYASAGAVYRELLQNSNDAGAKVAELRFTVDKATQQVTEVVYRNNGQPFRPQDWQRLRKIAEGNPDPAKIGAFGVGAYTMFSICEEPMVISGKQVLIFFWKGDSLWTKTADRTDKCDNDPWTSFCLPSRDVYALPDLAELGEFLAASLTFTQSLQSIAVFVNDTERLSIRKSILVPPRPVARPKDTTSKWWNSTNNSESVTTQSPQGLFRLPKTTDNQNAMQESVVQVEVKLDQHTAVTQARFITAVATTHLNRTLVNRMERVTKKQPPKQVTLSLFLNYDLHEQGDAKARKNPAHRVTQSLAPPAGAGRIFIVRDAQFFALICAVCCLTHLNTVSLLSGFSNIANNGVGCSCGSALCPDRGTRSHGFARCCPTSF